VKKQSLIDKACAKHANIILTGTVLCIDPSIGSKSSQPGYAIYVAGALEDSGFIELGTAATGTVAQRLHKFRMTLEEDFQKPDLVVVERIVINPKAKGYNNVSVLKLNQAVGVTMSQWDVPVIEVSPMSWKATAKTLDAYEKTDEWDGIALGWCVLTKAKESQS
jgi:Holliday junction resolvasome RuvABC endonuclease subunit